MLVIHVPDFLARRQAPLTNACKEIVFSLALYGFNGFSDTTTTILTAELTARLASHVISISSRTPRASLDVFSSSGVSLMREL
jgi:hypothetical protein